MNGQHFLNAPEGTDIAGFAVDGLVGTGGYGVVYRATRGGAVVALKLQPLESLGKWAEREVSILLRLTHRNVVGFRGCGLYPEQSPRWFYLAMEYVHGRTLSRWVDEENPSARRAAELLRGLARGLEATHAAQVLHRDIKESNVVVREEDGEPVLVDFGVGAYAGAPRLTSGVLPPGTPRYRSPEALAFRRAARPGERYTATAADDLYALGVTFYWVLTARHPFAGAEAPSEVDAVISVEPVAPCVLNPRVPVELSALCLRLLSKQPEARGNARGLREEVEAVLAGADARWEEPLCEAHPEVPSPDGHPEALDAWVPEHTPSDEGQDSLEAWVREGAGHGGPPRRGRRAKRVMEARAPAVPALEVRARPATEPAPAASAMFRATAVLGMALGLVVAVLLALGWRPPASFTALGGSRVGALPGREVAPVDLPPESGRAAAPRLAERPPAAVASSATPPQEEDVPVNVKKSPDAPATPPHATPKPRALKSMANAVRTAAVCTGLACASSPQLRPPPPAPEECPPGAVEAMKKLEIRMGATGDIYFLEMAKPNAVVTVREQRVRVYVGPSLGKLNNGILEGRLMLGDRVYGRFTEGYSKGGKERFPVCLELVRVDERERRFKPGIEPEPNSLGPDTARIWSAQTVQMVTSFD
ncbi:serine/threonine protein kinase [Pyxidicoccus trucidator]|uniref:serine/threonine protein kinase n=1 Tax=Pyxidicoccus trucidator TaxID=2709662 RepID=UPI0013DAAE68|nr:serine/threonine protein kinase [Pyxidicoccus trucidator]